jgi:carbon-monoxide dehydrogenase small subunit
MSQKINVKLNVNDKEVSAQVYPMMRLLDFLREHCRLTGTKEGCGEGECGACSVFLDGELVNACLVPVLQATNRKVTTIEGLSTSSELHPVQKSFLEHGGAQCGICTPGMVMASVELLRKNQNPSRKEIKTGLSGNLCRCTGYMKIFDSVEKAIGEKV